jgi:hypothetical protein
MWEGPTVMSKDILLLTNSPRLDWTTPIYTFRECFKAGAKATRSGPDEFPEGTRPLFAYIMAHLDLNQEDSQSITNAQAEKLSWKIRELHRRVYWGNHPLWKSDE